ncbi:MAG TPA: hypothetical protein ENJ53_01060 [Phaeodactylibacter sp.]|nr:hypothetical protein [Phaeodactylibacter sp.]
METADGRRQTVDDGRQTVDGRRRTVANPLLPFLMTETHYIKGGNGLTASVIQETVRRPSSAVRRLPSVVRRPFKVH